MSVLSVPTKLTAVQKFGSVVPAGLSSISNVCRSGHAARQIPQPKTQQIQQIQQIGVVPGVTWSKRTYQDSSPVGAERKLIHHLFLAFHLSHVAKPAHGNGFVLILVLPYAMLDLVRHVRKWDLHRAVFVAVKKRRGDALILIIRMDGVVVKFVTN
jgi:hypothetical protein